MILLGSFLGPVTFVTYAFEHRISDDLTEQTIFVGFMYGGVLGVLGATMLESIFIHHQTLGSFLGLGSSRRAASWRWCGGWPGG